MLKHHMESDPPQSTNEDKKPGLDLTFQERADRKIKIEEKYADTIQLRKEAIEQVKSDTGRRIAENPKPSAEEIEVGCFEEMLEPQVREAVFQFNRKGYHTVQSGFWRNGTQQVMDGYFELDDETQKQLEELGVKFRVRESRRRGGTIDKTFEMTFVPSEYRLDSIKKEWDRIANIVPDKNIPITRHMSPAAIAFRYRFAPEAAPGEFQEYSKRVMEDPERREETVIFLERLEKGEGQFTWSEDRDV